MTAASPARHTSALARRLATNGPVQVIATVDAVSWLDFDQLLAVSGYPVVSSVGDLAGGSLLLGAAAVVVSPATFNTIAKLACGVNDSLALNVVHDAIGAGRRVLVQPHVSTTLHAHPLLRRNLMVLTELGVHVVEEPACEGGCPAGHHDSALDAALE